MNNLFLVYFVNLYMFRSYLGPSSGGKPYVYNSWYLLFFLDDCLLSWLDWNPTRTTGSYLKKVPIVVYIRLYLLMMGLDTPETCRG